MRKNFIGRMCLSSNSSNMYYRTLTILLSIDYTLTVINLSSIIRQFHSLMILSNMQIPILRELIRSLYYKRHYYWALLMIAKLARMWTAYFYTKKH
ncbi:unnamed protein product [Oppiella nova]|uniref:Uncharacterized protein n=1 Tax=Oppiella nova TaxID=334625 RepID=A0A7R9MQ37_9ACAR|nr:unnamed protein product [Oppiella nova]CAG2181142.1 unnamed protein product [Oppiella nova]